MVTGAAQATVRAGVTNFTMGAGCTCSTTKIRGDSKTGANDEHGWRRFCKQKRFDLDHLHSVRQCHLAKRCKCPKSQKGTSTTCHNKDNDHLVVVLQLWNRDVWTLGICLCITIRMSTTLSLDGNGGP